MSNGLSLSDTYAVDSKVRMHGVGMQYLGAPLHTVHLESDLAMGPVIVGVQPCFPTEGVAFILGNDLAGGKVKPEVTTYPDVFFCLCCNPGYVKALSKDADV